MAGRIENCRICGGDELTEVLDLGHIPHVDNFKTEKQIRKPERHYPLKTVICEDCGLFQLEYIVPKERLFNDNYAYDMSVTKAGVEHFRQMAKDIDRRYPEHSSVMDIGSNTGVLLKGFAEQGWDIIGLEPSENIYRRAVAKGVPTENVFFSEKEAERIRRKHGSRDVITATNVFAHIEDLHDAIRGIKTVLDEDGVFILETPYLVDLIEKNEFDTIYHEHLSYFSVKPLSQLFNQHSMEIIDIEKQDIHGGSIRVHVARKDKYKKNDSVERYLESEQKNNVHSRETIEKFRERVEDNRRKLVEMVNQISDDGCSIAGVGAPAKGVTLLNYCGFDSNIIPYISEKSEIKIGKYVPGTHNKVVSDKTLVDRQPEYALLLPWNFSESIIENLTDYEGRFIVPIPEPRIIEP